LVSATAVCSWGSGLLLPVNDAVTMALPEVCALSR